MAPLSMRDTSRTVAAMALVEVSPAKVSYIKVNSMRTRWMDMDSSTGQTGESTKDNGLSAKSMAKESISGQMDRSMMENSRTTTALDSEFSTIQTVKGSKEHGRRAISMVRASISSQEVPCIQCHMSTERKLSRESFRMELSLQIC